VKRKGYIYEEICHKENIRMAILKASKGKRHRGKVYQQVGNERP
jgi:hypothetical protein